MRYLGERKGKSKQVSEQDLQKQGAGISRILGAPARPIDERTRSLAAFADATIRKLQKT